MVDLLINMLSGNFAKELLIKRYGFSEGLGLNIGLNSQNFREAQDLKKRKRKWSTQTPEETTSEQFVSMRIWGSDSLNGQYTLQR